MTPSLRTNGLRQAGLSLVELMVSLAIGGFLMLGVVTVFLANRDSARLENSLATVQESARTAVDLLRDDLQRAQYLGCNTPDVVLTDMRFDPTAVGVNNTLDGIRGYERLGNGNWVGAPPLPVDAAGNNPDWAGAITATNRGARFGSDVLRLRINDRLDSLLTAEVDAASSTVDIDDNPECRIGEGSLLVLTRCGLTAHLFEVTNVPACDLASPPNAASLEFEDPENFVTSMDARYFAGVDGSELMFFEEVYWFVSDTGRNRNGMDVWALYRQSNNGAVQEMVEGVEHMQVEFGQQLVGSDNLRFVDPSDATLNTGLGYQGVKTVRIALLVQGFEPIRTEDDTSEYVLLGDETNKIVVAPGATLVGQGAEHGGGTAKRSVITLAVELRNAPTPR